MEIKRSHALFIVALAAIAVYANSIANGFAYDDTWIIQRNDRVHQLADLGKIWLTPYWPSFGSQLGLYRPFAIFAFAIEWAISGGAPWFFHLVNVLLHALVSVLVFVLIEKLFTRRAAFAGALVFAVHPLHTEAVANVVGQNELWAALGVLAACIIYIGRPEGIALQPKRMAAILALYAMALLAKESAVVLPGLLVLLDFVQQRARAGKRELMTYARGILPLVIVCTLLVGGYLVLRHSVLGNLAGTDAAPGLPHLREGHRLLNAFRAWPEFVRLLFFPLDLTVDYAPAVVLPVESWSPMVLLGAVLVFACVVLTLSTPQAPRAGVVAGWFLISILPVANFFFPIGVLIAERTLYLPSIAICFLAGFAWDAASQSVERETRRLALAISIAVLGFFGVRTVIRNPDWDSLASVWQSLIRDHPESYRSQWLNALAEWNLGHMDLAERYFEIAYRIWPRDSQMVAEWGNFYVAQRKYDKAIALLEQSREMTPFVPRTHAYLSYAYLYGGRPQDALETGLHANQMEGAPTAIILPTVAGSYERLGRYREAAEAWRSTVKLPGGDMWLNWAMLARAEAWAGDVQSALRTADIAIAKTAKDGPSRTAAQKLKVAISDGCYRAGSATSCDPLEGWQVTVATATGGARSAP